MANNILTAEIRVIAPGAAEAFNKVSANVKKTEASLQQLSTTSSTAGGSVTILAKNTEKAAEATSKAGAGFKSMAGSVQLMQFASIAALGALAAIGKEIIGMITGANRLASVTKILAGSLKEAQESTRGEVIQLGILLSIAKDTTASYSSRQGAIDKLNKSYPELHKNLTLENIGTQSVAEAVEALTKNLIAEARVKSLLNTVTLFTNELEGLNKLGGTIFGGSPVDNAKREAIRRLTEDIAGVTQEIKNLQSELLKGSGLFGSRVGGAGGGFGGLLGGLSEKTINPGKINIAPKKITFDFRTAEIDLGRPEDFNPIATEFGVMFSKELQDYFGKDPVVLDESLVKAKSVSDAAEQLAKDFTDAFNAVLATGFADSFEAIGTGIGNIISGSNFGEQFAQVFGDLFTNIGKALIKFGIIKTGIDALLANFEIPGAVAIALGVFAIAAGSLVKNLAGARAHGGPVGGGQTYLVGERGPELFTPNTGGNITPNNQLGGRGIGASGGMAVQVSGQFLQRGQDLLAVITLAQQSRNRLQ